MSRLSRRGNLLAIDNDSISFNRDDGDAPTHMKCLEILIYPFYLNIQNSVGI